MGRKIFSFKYVVTVLLTLAILILGGLNVQQKRRYIPPDDGASWIQSAAGVRARAVARAARAAFLFFLPDVVRFLRLPLYGQVQPVRLDDLLVRLGIEPAVTAIVFALLPGISAAE